MDKVKFWLTTILIICADLHQLDVPDIPVPAPLQPAGSLQQSHLR